MANPTADYGTDLLADNAKAYGLLAEFIRTEMKDMPVADAVWKQYRELCLDVQVSLHLYLRDHAEVGREVHDVDGPMLVASVGATLSHAMVPGPLVVLTDDGGLMREGWHDGPETDEPVRYARYFAGQHMCHGWLHPETRRIVQTG